MPTSIVKFQLRNGTASNWAGPGGNPVLIVGEPGFESDTNKLKIGDGSSSWNSLPYLNISGPTGPTGPTGTPGAQGNTGPTGPQPSVTLSYGYQSPIASSLAISTPTYLNPTTAVSIAGNISNFAFMITGNIRIIGTFNTSNPSTWDFKIGLFDSSNTFPAFQQYITIARDICPSKTITSTACEIPFSGFLTSNMVNGSLNSSETYTLKIYYTYSPQGGDGASTYYLDMINCCIQRLY